MSSEAKIISVTLLDFVQSHSRLDLQKFAAAMMLRNEVPILLHTRFKALLSEELMLIREP